MEAETKPQRTFADAVLAHLEKSWAETDRRKAAKRRAESDSDDK